MGKGKPKKEKSKEKKQAAPPAVEVRGVVGQQPYLGRPMIPQAGSPMGRPPSMPYVAPVAAQPPPRPVRPTSLQIAAVQEYRRGAVHEYHRSDANLPVSQVGLRRMDPLVGTPDGPASATVHNEPMDAASQRSPMPYNIPGAIRVMPGGGNSLFFKRQSQAEENDVLSDFDDTLRQFELPEADYVQEGGPREWKRPPPVAHKPHASPSRVMHAVADPPPDYDLDDGDVPVVRRPSGRVANGHGKNGSLSSNDSTPTSSVRQQSRILSFDQELRSKLEKQLQQMPDVSGQVGRGREVRVPDKKTHFTMLNAQKVAQKMSEEFVNKRTASDPPDWRVERADSPNAWSH